MKLLITAIGKRVQLIKYLKRNCYVVGVDSGELVASEQYVDSFYKVPRYDSNEYIEALVTICQKEQINFLIPLYEKEFISLCDNRQKFKNVGTTLLLNNKEIIEICNNKWNTYRFFKENDIASPISYLKSDIEDILINQDNLKSLRFPLIIKPIDGMGSSGVFKINNKNELEFFKEYIKNPIIQEFIEGTEYTVDVLCDLYGNVVSAVPRERIEVRSGEVVKSKTTNNKKIIAEVLQLCEKLNTIKDKKGIGLVGPQTIQCMYTRDNEIRFIEINPRFGGGVPLSIEAGIDYGMIFDIMNTKKNFSGKMYEFKEVTMIRYDEAVFK